MQEQNTIPIRLCRFMVKLFYRFLWQLIRFSAKKPVIEVLYQSSEDKNSVVFCCHGPVYIEPEYGFIITEQGYVIEDSMTPNFPFSQRPFGTAVPSPFRFFKAIRENRVISLDAAISLRHFWEWNYYHFYLDVLGKAELIQTAGVTDSLPLVLARYASTIPFVRPLIERGKFRHRQWIIPGTEYVRAEKILFCQTRRAYGPRVHYLLEALESEPTERHEGQQQERRVYLKRSGNRRLSNLEEVKPVLAKYGFQIVDAAEMRVEQQIALFRDIRYLIANHGAGTTNILFRGKAPLSLLELHHENLINYDHKCLCEELYYDWDHLEGKMGQGTPAHADFSVCPKELEQKIIRMLGSVIGFAALPTLLLSERFLLA